MHPPNGLRLAGSYVVKPDARRAISPVVKLQ